MGADRTKLTDLAGIKSILKGDFLKTFGAKISHFHKPFTTKIDATGYPNYKLSVYATTGIVGSGGHTFIGADSSGLNPFGPNTLAEGLVSGDDPTAIADLDNYIDYTNVRAYGHKTPSNHVGWGFDKFGFPTPNSNVSWNVSGIYAGAGPNSTFLGSGGLSVSHGREVPYGLWNAGPADLRWDQERKIWTSPQSVYSANIIRVYATGGGAIASDQFYFADDIRYDAEIYDGVANRIRVTGVLNIGPRPYNDSFKIKPLASGDFAFIVHAIVNNRPNYALWIVEPPGTEACTSTTSSSAESIFASVGGLTYDELLVDPLSAEYGGTGFGDHPSGKILIGDRNGSGVLEQLTLTAGSGIDITSSATVITLALSTGVAFVSAGVNNTITELQGLTTPLTIGQGGTGASTKNFVDLTTTQNVSGIKTFQNPVRIASGTYSNPSLAFKDETNTGLYKGPSGSIGVTASGIKVLEAGFNYANIHSSVYIRGTNLPTDADGTTAPLVVQAYANDTLGSPIFVVNNPIGNRLGSIDLNGQLNIPKLAVTGIANPSGNLIELFPPSNLLGYTIIASGSASGNYFSVNKDGTEMKLGASGNQTTLTSTSGNRTIHFSSGYHGDIAVAKVGGGTRTLHVMHGLIAGYTDS